MSDQSVEHIAKSIGLAEKLTAKAEDALSGLEYEMIVRKWPADLRAILWDAVAMIATQRANDAKNQI